MVAGFEGLESKVSAESIQGDWGLTANTFAKQTISSTHIAQWAMLKNRPKGVEALYLLVYVQPDIPDNAGQNGHDWPEMQMDRFHKKLTLTTSCTSSHAEHLPAQTALAV